MGKDSPLPFMMARVVYVPSAEGEALRAPEAPPSVHGELGKLWARVKGHGSALAGVSQAVIPGQAAPKALVGATQGALEAVWAVAGRIGQLDPFGAYNSPGDWYAAALHVAQWREVLNLSRETEKGVSFYSSGGFARYMRDRINFPAMSPGLYSFLDEFEDPTALPKTMPAIRELFSTQCLELFLTDARGYRIGPRLKMAGPGWGFAYQGSCEAWALFELSQEFQRSVVAKCKRPGCNEPVDTSRKGKVGRPDEYCSDGCRARHRDDRKRGKALKETGHKNYIAPPVPRKGQGSA